MATAVAVSNRLKLAHTFAIWLGIFALGAISSVVGSTWIDLAEIYHTNIESITQVVTSRGIGFLLGALTSGYIFGHFHTLRAVTVACIVAGISIIMIPLSGGSLTLAHMDFAVVGYAFGVYDTGCYYWLINTWPDQSGPWIQSFHSSYGIGGLSAPLIAEPFLSVHNNQTDLFEKLEVTSRIWIPYAIFGGLFLLDATLIIILHCINKKDVKSPKSAVDTASDDKFFLKLILLLAAYLLVYTALEGCTNEMLGVFAVNCDLHLTKSEASYLLSVYWAMFTTGRLIGVVRALKFKSFTLLVADHFCVFVALAILFFFGNNNRTALWIATALVGFGQSAIYGTATAWFMEYGNMTSVYMSYIMLGTHIGGMAPPFLVGKFIEQNPFVLIYVLMGCTTVLSIILAIMVYATKDQNPKIQRENNLMTNADCELKSYAKDA